MPTRLAIAIRRLIAAALGAVTLAAAAGCEPQADTEYRGEPLAHLTGTITSSVEDPPTTLQAMLGWTSTYNQGGDVFLAELAVISAEFPARFQLDLYEPPAEDLLNDFTRAGERPNEVRLGVAPFIALPPDYDSGVYGEEGPEVYGLAEHQLLIYVDRDVQPDTISAEILGGELEAGFHLMDVIDRDDPSCQGDFDCMRLAPEDLDSEIRVRIDNASLLDFPDWT